MVFSDNDIKKAIEDKKIIITPEDDSMIQPSSYDVRLSNKFRVFNNYKYSIIDPREKQLDLTSLVELKNGSPFILHPGEFILGSTLEVIGLDKTVVARIEGKSSLGRLGLLIHSTAGYVDPGFKGTITLELSNVANLPIALYPGMKIGQLSFMNLCTPCETPYGSRKIGSKYQNQVDPTASEYYKNFKKG
ncbi:MAG: dCTP deaminase [Patescibacteria group bacterium]